MPTSSTLEQQAQARVAQAKEAARWASIAAAARSSDALHGPSVASTGAASNGFVQPPPPLLPSQPPVCQAAAATTDGTMALVPRDVRHRIDRLVDFVARNGDAFEATVRQRERANPDFAFLRPGGPFSAYYHWKKQQTCGNASPAAGCAAVTSSSSSLSDAAHAAASTRDPLGDMSVGAMANVCKYARASGVQAYAPIPLDIVQSVGNLPPVEPARLEIRLAEFYRQEAKRNRRS